MVGNGLEQAVEVAVYRVILFLECVEATGQISADAWCVVVSE